MDYGSVEEKVNEKRESAYDDRVCEGKDEDRPNERVKLSSIAY